MKAVRYEEWRNEPTRRVNRWLADDRALDSRARTLVLLELGGPAPRAAVADALRSWVQKEHAPELIAPLDEVDWLQLADAWIEAAST